MKSRALAFGCLLLGGILGLISSAQPWWRASGEGVVVKFTGTQVAGGLSQALGIVALAGTLLMLVLQARGRRVVGAVLLLVGLGLVLSGTLRLQPSADAVRSQVREVSLVDAFQLSVTSWPWIFAFSGVLIVTGAVLTLITAAQWPARSERFRAGRVPGQLANSDDPAELWKAMDAGADPTADDHDTPIRDDPKVRDRSSGDTMDATEQVQQLPWSPTSHIPGRVQRDWRGREA
jgi:uncharacterized membrane protein (TIGR02234 family)